MVWPADPVDLDVGILIDGAWVNAADVGDGVLERADIDISYGRRNWAAQTDSASVSLPLANRDGRWSPDNPSSPYAGHYRRNIPLRLGVGRGDPFLESSGLNADVASTPDTSGSGGSPTAPAAASTTTSSETTATTSHVVDMPATLAATDRLLLVISAGHTSLTPADQGGGVTDLDDWTAVDSYQIYTAPTDWSRVLVYELELDTAAAAALAGGSVEFSTTLAVRSAAQVIRTTGARSGGQGTAWAYQRTAAKAFSSAPNSPSLTAPWGADEHRWYTVATYGTGGNDVATYPAGYTALADNDVAGTTLGVATAHRTTSAATEDPGAFALDGDENWQAATFVYRAVEVAGADGALDLAGDIDLRVEIRSYADIGDLTITGAQPTRLAHKSSGADGWELELSRVGPGTLGMRFSWYDSGGTRHVAETYTTGGSLPLSLMHDRGAVRVELDSDNGASGHDIDFYHAATIAGPWTQVGSTITRSGTTSIRTNDAPIRVGGNPNDANHRPMVGRIYAFQMRAGAAASPVADIDFTAQTIGDTSFVGDDGLTWTVGAGARITNTQWRMHGELSTLPLRNTIDGQDVWSPVEAQGLFRRLRQGNRRVESALRRAIVRTAEASSVVQYWPMEETGDNVTAFGPAVGTNQLDVIGTPPQAASDATFLASSPLPTLDGSQVLAFVDTYTATGAWQVRWLQHVPATFTGSEFTYLGVFTTDLDWYVRYQDTAGGQLRLLAFRGASQQYDSGWVSFDATGAAMRMSLSVVQNGSNVNVGLEAQDQDDPTGGGFITNNAVAGSAGRVSKVNISGATATDWGFGHLTVQSVRTPTSELATQLNAYTSEKAGVRIERLCREEGIASRIIGDPTTTEAMGPQRPGTLMDLLQECADTDLGILHEAREAVAVAYRTRESILDQAAVLTLDAAAGELAGPLDLDRDDSEFANDVQVENWNGTTARAALDDGTPQSVSEPPVGAGRYDSTFSVNGLNSRLQALAETRLALSSVDEPRISRAAVALHQPALVADAALSAAVLDMRLGDRVDITNYLPAALGASSTISQIVQGYGERIGNYRHRFDLLTSPYSPWATGGGVVTPPDAHTVTFRSQQSLATPGTPDHVLTALGRTDPAAITRADLDDILDDWVASTGGTTRNVTSAATWATACAAARPGDLIRVTSSFTLASGRLEARGNLYGLSGTTLTASPAGGTPGLPIIVTCADGASVTGPSATSTNPVLSIDNCRHVWAVGFNVAGTTQFGIRGQNMGGTAGFPAYIAYCTVNQARDWSISVRGWFQDISASGGTPTGNAGEDRGFSEFVVVESNTVTDPNPGDVAGNPGEGVYLGDGGNPDWEGFARDVWCRGNSVANFKANAYECKPGCRRIYFTDNVAVSGRMQLGAAFELAYLSTTATRPAWADFDPEIYAEGNRVYDLNITETGTSRNYFFLVGIAGVRVANNLLWSARNASGNFGTSDTFYAVLVGHESLTTDFGDATTTPTWVVNNNWQARALTDPVGHAGVIQRNNITFTGYGGTHIATADDYIATVPAVGSLDDAEWETYGPGSAFDLALDSDLIGAGTSIADLDLFIEADISDRAIPTSAPNPGPFQPHPANA